MLFVFSIAVAILNAATIINAKHEWKTPRCHAGDGGCLPEVINYYLKNGAEGIPSMNLIPLDPLFVPDINIIQGNDSPVNIKLRLQNVTFTGFSDLRVSKIVGFEKDPKGSKFELYGFMPKLTLLGQYSVSGSVIVLPVVGNGKANLTFVGLDEELKLYPTIEHKNGKEYVHMNKVRADFNTTRLYMDFENLFNGDKVLGDTTNQFLNENWQDILNELKPVLKDVTSGIAQNIIKAVFDKFPYKNIFLE